MTRQDQFHKWALYALALLPIWLLETLVLSRLPVFGVIPVLMPLAAVAVGLWEGPRAGALYGLCVGVVADATYPGVPGGMTLGVCLLGWLTGAASDYGMRQTAVGALLCSSIAMLLLEFSRVGWGTLSGLGSPMALLPVALGEGLWSLCWALPIYGLYKLVYRKVGGDQLGG